MGSPRQLIMKTVLLVLTTALLVAADMARGPGAEVEPSVPYGDMMAREERAVIAVYNNGENGFETRQTTNSKRPSFRDNNLKTTAEQFPFPYTFAPTLRDQQDLNRELMKKGVYDCPSSIPLCRLLFPALGNQNQQHNSFTRSGGNFANNMPMNNFKAEEPYVAYPQYQNNNPNLNTQNLYQPYFQRQNLLTKTGSQFPERLSPMVQFPSPMSAMAALPARMSSMGLSSGHTSDGFYQIPVRYAIINLLSPKGISFTVTPSQGVEINSSQTVQTGGQTVQSDLETNKEQPMEDETPEVHVE